MRVSTKFSIAAVAGLLALCAPAAFAQAPNNPVGLWNVQAYYDNTPALTPAGSQNICFVANGTWYSPTFPNWNGRWYQKGSNNAGGNGDRVRILGNWAFGAGNDSSELSFVHMKLMTGGWHEWTDGFFVLWLQLEARRIGSLCPPPLFAAPKAFDDKAIDDEAARHPWEEQGASPPTCEELDPTK